MPIFSILLHYIDTKNFYKIFYFDLTLKTKSVKLLMHKSALSETLKMKGKKMTITIEQKNAIKYPCLMFANTIMSMFNIVDLDKKTLKRIPIEKGSPTYDLQMIDNFFMIDKERLTLTNDEIDCFIKFLESQLKMIPDKKAMQISEIKNFVTKQTNLIIEVYFLFNDYLKANETR